MNIEQIYDELKEKISDSEIRLNENMSKHSTFKIGGNADIFVKIKSKEDLIYIIKYTKENNIPLTIIGNCSNVLIKDNGIRGITICLDFNQIDIKKQDEEFIINVGSGVKLGMLSAILLKNEIQGFEFASGIPGTIGGAVRMNAGAYGKEMKDIILSVTSIDEYGNVREHENKELNFSYRYSKFKENKEIILNTTLKLSKGKLEDIKEKIEQYAKSRKDNQPVDMPSVGSTFKRGKDFISAQLIDEAGLKGYKIGGAQVSTKHAGFIINTGNATAKDVLELVEYVKKEVYKKFGKKLELEMEIIGE